MFHQREEKALNEDTSFEINPKPVSTSPLSEKCPNAEFFWSVFSENTDQKKLRIWTLFTQWP